MMKFSQDQNQSPDSGNQDRRDEARNVVQISQFREMDTAPVFALVDLQEASNFTTTDPGGGVKRS